MSLDAFITGSRKYGTPRKWTKGDQDASDLDLVLFMDQADLKILADHFGDEGAEDELPVEYGGSTFVFSIDDLNLIVFSDEAKYDAWKRGTADCFKRRPVTREDAVETICGYEKCSRSYWRQFRDWANARSEARYSDRMERKGRRMSLADMASKLNKGTQ
jgi:hypothetical protein